MLLGRWYRDSPRHKEISLGTSLVMRREVLIANHFLHYRSSQADASIIQLDLNKILLNLTRYALITTVGDDEV